MLFEAALREVDGKGQPTIIVGDFNIEPTKTLALLQGDRLGIGLVWKRGGLLPMVNNPASLARVLGNPLGLPGGNLLLFAMYEMAQPVLQGGLNTFLLPAHIFLRLLFRSFKMHPHTRTCRRQVQFIVGV